MQVKVELKLQEEQEVLVDTVMELLVHSEKVQMEQVSLLQEDQDTMVEDHQE